MKKRNNTIEEEQLPAGRGIQLSQALMAVSVGLVFAAVFALSDSLALGVVSAKEFWLYGAMGCCGISTIIFVCFHPQFKINFSYTDLLLLLFTLIGMLPFLCGAEAVNVHCIHLSLLAMLYVFFRMALTTSLLRYLIPVMLLLSSAAQAIWGLLQLYGYLTSQHNLFVLTGTFFNPGPYSGYLAMLSPFAVHYLLHDFRIFTRSFHPKHIPIYMRWSTAAMALLTTLLVLPAGMSRAAWLASAAGCLVVLVPCFNKKYQLFNRISRYKRRILPALLVFTALLLVGLSALYHFKKDSADGRALIWKNTVKAIYEHPFGVGIGHFAEAYGKEQVAYFESGTATAQEIAVAGNPEYAFNEYLQIGLEVGIPGLLIFISALFFLLKRGIKHQKYQTAGATVSLLVFAAMSYPFSVLAFQLVFVCLLAHLAADTGSRGLHAPAKSTLLPAMSLYWLLPVTTVVTAACLYNRYPTYKAFKDWTEAKTLYNMQLYSEAAPEYARLALCLSDRVEFLFEQAQVLSKTGDYDASNRVLKKAMTISCDPMLYNIAGKNYQALKDYSRAEQCFTTAANMVPGRMYPHYLLALLYDAQNNSLKFRQAAHKVLSLQPKIHSPAIDEMRHEIKRLLKQHNHN